MRFFAALFLLVVTCGFLAGETALSDAQKKLAGEISGTFQTLDKQKAAAGAGVDGWLFFTGELRLLSVGRFWGDDATKVSRAHKPELADPLPAILDFHQQLKARGIEVRVAPVAPKAA